MSSFLMFFLVVSWVFRLNGFSLDINGFGLIVVVGLGELLLGKGLIDHGSGSVL